MPINSYSRKELRAAVKNIKLELVKEEKRNVDKLYFYMSPSGGDWFVAGDRSALMFMNLYAKRLNYNGELRKDNDTFAKFSTGTVKLPNFDKHYAPRLKELGLKEIKPNEIKNAELMRVFKLPQKLSYLDIERWRNKLETERAQTNEYLEGRFKQPKVFTQVRVEMLYIMNFVYKLPAPQREIHGNQAGEIARDLYLNWLAMASGDLELKTYLEKLVEGTKWLLNWLHLLLDSHDAQQKFIANRAEALLKIRAAAQEELDKMKKD